MKEYFEIPEIKVIKMVADDIIATSGVSRGSDIENGESVQCDAPDRWRSWYEGY